MNTILFINSIYLKENIFEIIYYYIFYKNISKLLKCFMNFFFYFENYPEKIIQIIELIWELK